MTGSSPTTVDPTAADSRAARRRLGAFFTPQALAEAVVGYVLTHEGPPLGAQPRVLDPACGEGVFLAAAAQRLPAARLMGIEHDPATLAVARARVPGLDARLGDGLDPACGPPPGSVDLLLGNPPFVRCRSMAAARRDQLRSWYATARGSFDLAVPFVERALGWLRPGGRLALILPNKLLVARYAAALRRLLCERVTIDGLLDLSDHDLFAAAAAYPVVLLVTASPPRPAARVRLAEARLVPPSSAGGAPARLELLAERWVPQLPDELAASPQADPLAARLTQAGLPLLGDLFRPREGLHTGNCRALLVGRAPDGPDSRPLLRGRDCGRYLLRWDGWWTATDPARLDRSAGHYAHFPPAEVFRGPKLLLREIAPRPAASLDLGDHWTLNKVYPLQERRPLSVDERLACLGLLNSTVFFRLFTALFRANHLRGGHLQFKAHCVQRMPLPPPAEGVRCGLPALVRQRLERGPQPELEEALDRAALVAYGEGFGGLT